MEGLYTQAGQEGKDISERRSGHSRMSADTCEFLHPRQTFKSRSLSSNPFSHSIRMSVDIVEVFTPDKIFKSRGLSLVIMFNFMGSFKIVTIVFFCASAGLYYWCEFNEVPTPPSQP